MNDINIPEDVRRFLKRPLGKLIPGEPVDTRPVLKSLLQERRGKLVAVGDAVTRELLAIGVKPDLSIVDGKIERRPVERVDIAGALELSCENRAGTISAGAYCTVAEALKHEGPVIVRVNGEEDLLGLVVISEAPLGTLMLYGQPREGVVIVDITEDVRRLGRRLIEASSQG